MIGEVIGNYRIVAELGKGGMGVVYRAEHIQLGRPAALKMLLPQLSSEAGIVQRFFNEARAASAIDHPGIVEVYDFGTHTDGRAYIVMALLKGESLENRLVSGPLSPADGATIIAQVAAALGAAHARGIIHRDLKPDNVFLVPNELVPGGIQVKLLDFGIAKLADEKTAGFKTQTGALMGTPAYMSPEQCMGRADLDHRTDIYSLGCILFHVLCGRPPFMSDQGTGMMIAAHIRDAAPDPRSINPHVPAPLAAIIARCLEKEPSARYQTAAELRNALVAAGANAPLSKPPVASADAYGATIAPMGTAPNIGTAPTTHSSSAAQVMAQPAPTASGKKKGKGGLIAIGAVVLVAVGAVGFALVRNGGDFKKPETIAASQPAAPMPAPAQPVDAQPAQPVAQPIAPPDAALASCTDGQVQTIDTRGHCCWGDQVWSDTKSKCLGKPTCPPGMNAKGESCIAVVIAKSTPTIPKDVDKTPVPLFAVNAKVYAPGDNVEITFGSPVSSKSGDQAWITISEKGSAETQYGPWEYVQDGATNATLKAPKRAGDYEVRIHTNFPTKAYNVRYRVPITIKGKDVDKVDAPPAAAGATPLAKQTFKLTNKKLRAGSEVVVTFPEPMHALPGEQFWITIVEADKAADQYGTYEYVAPDAKTAKLPVPTTPGEYEVRLHANYPTKTTNLVHRARVHVE